MKVGLFVPTAAPIATPEFVSGAARATEERGFDSIWVPEHVVLFDEHASRYPYSDDGKIPGVSASQLGMLEPLSTLCYMAAETSRIRLGTGVCLVPQRNPVYTAKEVANVDWLSKGRFDFGIGVGWLAEEFKACGVPFERRGARTDAYIQAMKSLWCDEISEFKDEFYEIPATRFLPKPIQTPHPPIHVGGETTAALRRAARYGQGWFGFNRSPEQVKPAVEELEALLQAEGRDPGDIEVSIGPYSYELQEGDVAAYADAGVDQLIVFAMAPTLDPFLKKVDDLANTVVEACHAL